MRLASTHLVLALLTGTAVALCSGCSGDSGDDTADRDVAADTDTGADTDVAADTDTGADTDVTTDTDVATDTSDDTDVANDTGDDAGPTCAISVYGPEDRDRVILVGHTFGERQDDGSAADGTELHSLQISLEGVVSDLGHRLDIGFRPNVLAFAPSGQVALALGEREQLVSVGVAEDGSLSEIDRITLPSSGYSQIVMSHDGRRAFIVDTNSADTSGVRLVELGCDGSLTHVEEAFYYLRLAGSMALSADESWAIVAGGQASFEPVDDNDAHLLNWNGTGWDEVGTFDVWADSNRATQIALSPDQTTVAIPNNMMFSEETSQLRLFRLQDGELTLSQQFEDIEDIQRPIFSTDGATLLVTQAEPGRVAIFEDADGGFVQREAITGIGLADHVAVVRRGVLTDHVLITSIDPSGGSNVALLVIEGPGQVADHGQFVVGEDLTSIMGPIAVQP